MWEYWSENKRRFVHLLLCNNLFFILLFILTFEFCIESWYRFRILCYKMWNSEETVSHKRKYKHSFWRIHVIDMIPHLVLFIFMIRLSSLFTARQFQGTKYLGSCLSLHSLACEKIEMQGLNIWIHFHCIVYIIQPSDTANLCLFTPHVFVSFFRPTSGVPPFV